MIDAKDMDYQVFYQNIRKLDKAVGLELRKSLTAIARPIADEVKAAALAQPSKGGESLKHKKGQSDGLRRGIARAVQIKVSASRKNKFSIRIRVSGTAFRSATGKPATLPRYYEGLTKQNWRHPIFVKAADLPGDGAWVTQSPRPFMLKTIVPHKRRVADAVLKAFVHAYAETTRK